MKQADGVLLKMGQLARTFRKDGWKNLLTGLGVEGKDKRLGNKPTYVRFPESEAEQLYGCDDTASRIVDKIPEEGTRKWISWTADSSDESSVKMMQEEFVRLNVRKSYAQAWTWARLYGGSACLLSVDDGLELKEPLDLTKIRRVLALPVFDRRELDPRSIDGDVRSTNYGMPLTYQISPQFTAAVDQRQRGIRVEIENLPEVHHTRLIRFDGAKLPRHLFIANNYWSDSVLNRLQNVLRNYNAAHDSIASVLQDFRVGILRLQGLADMVAGGEKDVLKNRIEVMDLAKSILGTIVLDAEEEGFENLTTNLANLDKVITDVVDSRLVAATGMPHTVILGDGASGQFNNSGESEDRGFKELIASEQEKHLEKPLNIVSEAIQAAQRGPFRGRQVESLGWSFNRLWELDDKEQAEVHKVQAESDEKYFQMGALAPSEIRSSRFSSEEFSLKTTIDEEAEIEQEQTPLPGEEESTDAVITDVIRSIPGGFAVFSKTGKKLSKTLKTREEALERLREIEFFKNK